MPSFNYSSKIIKLFKNMLEIETNEEIQKFVHKYIGIGKNYSYHQINIFIKLFIRNIVNFIIKYILNMFEST